MVKTLVEQSESSDDTVLLKVLQGISSLVDAKSYALDAASLSQAFGVCFKLIRNGSQMVQITAGVSVRQVVTLFLYRVAAGGNHKVSS